MVVLHDAAGDGQAEAGAVGAAGKEGLEDARADRLRDAAAGVRQVELHDAAEGRGLLGAGHGEGAAMRHGVEGIEREVEDDLLQLALVALDQHRARRRRVVQLDAGLRELGAQQHERVVEDLGQRPAGMQRGRRAAEGEHAGDDALELLDLLGDDLQVAAARVVPGEVHAEGAVQELDDEEGIADLVGDLGGEQAEGGEGLVLAQHLLGLEHAGVEPGVLQGDGREAAEGGEQALLVVAEAVEFAVEDGQHARGLALKDQRHRQRGAEGAVARQVGGLAVAGAVDVLEFRGAAGADGGCEQGHVRGNGLLLQAESRGGQVAVGRPGVQAQFAALLVVVVEEAEPGVEQRAAALGQRGQQLLGRELGDERVAQLDEGGELLGIGAQPLVLPEAVQDGAGLGGVAGQPGQVVGGEGAEAVGVEVDDADGAAVIDERCGHLAADAGAGGDVARLGGDIGDQQRLAVQRDPAGDALARLEGELADVGRQTLLDADLEAAGLGAQQRHRAAVGGERRHDGREDVALRRRRVRRAGGQRGDGVENRQVLRVSGTHPCQLNRSGTAWGEKICVAERWNAAAGRVSGFAHGRNPSRGRVPP